jgi:hypothetical protein
MLLRFFSSGCAAGSFIEPGEKCLMMPPVPAQFQNYLVMREHARAGAWIRRDRRALEEVLAPGFVEINSFGRFTREELLDRLFPAVTLHEFVIEDPSVRITGENTAVLSYRCHERLTADKKETRGDFTVSATYTRDGNQYRLLVRECQPLV